MSPKKKKIYPGSNFKKDEKILDVVALRYNQENEKVPKVVAKGKGALAQRIIDLAFENGIPIKEDKDLVEILSKLELNEEIPEKLYRAIAEVLVFVYRMNRKAGENEFIL